MREHFNGEQSCEEQIEEEKLAAFLEEQMRKEAEQIEKELEDNPEIAALSPDDSAKEKLYERIEEYERQKAVRRLSPEDQEALRLGRQLQKEKAAEEKATVDSKSRFGHGKKRFFKRLAGIAAVFVIVAAVGITGVGGPDRVMEVLQQVVGSREVTKVNSDDKDILETGEEKEEEVYQKIKDKLGIDPVRMVKLLPGMELIDIQVDEELRVANVYYEKEGEIISYIINCSQDESVWGVDVEDTFIKRYIYPLQMVNVSVQEYEIKKSGEEKYTASFEYQDVHYHLTGIMTQKEMEEILNNLYFF